jgi:hypothetical protein
LHDFCGRSFVKNIERVAGATAAVERLWVWGIVGLEEWQGHG